MEKWSIINQLFVIPVITGIISSGIVTFLFIRLRPRFKVSNVIAVRKINGKTRFTIKVVNDTRFNFHNAKASLVLFRPYQVGPNLNIRTEDIMLIQNTHEFFPAKSKSQYSEHAVLFSTEEPILQISDSSSYFVFQIQAEHSLSGLRKFTSKKYFNRGSDIRKGTFKHGTKIEFVDEQD
ncbi:hypothetical protein [Roseivirga sp. E12]|uniref:hypothetical protein n=1 Tax=Roseivirga sp. E12 TaxID=2819237 RepID=UPI001ABBE5CE|nr:hypothetical protein [Roseivirga sp. E12]MBO3697781.1 hypothetical protein [Roseivirga sp. E12]